MAPIEWLYFPVSDSYGYSGKEFLTDGGLNFYDFGARTYVPDECRFWQPDPLADNYHWLSPYAYCGGDPINRIDPTGEKVYYLDMMGHIIEPSEKFNNFNQAEIDKQYEGLDCIVIIGGDGKVYNISPTFPKGTVTNTFEKSETIGNITINYTGMELRGDKEGIKAFEFLSENITDSDAAIEFTIIQYGLPGDSGHNLITTSHTPAKEYSACIIYNNKLQFGYTLRNWFHSHPFGNTAGDKDLEVKEKVNSKRSKPVNFMIYHVPTLEYISF